jgi:flagellar biogenesis protein FliO
MEDRAVSLIVLIILIVFAVWLIERLLGS